MLEHISRREFLELSACTAGSMFLPIAQSSEKKPKHSRLLDISDKYEWEDLKWCLRPDRVAVNLKDDKLYFVDKERRGSPALHIFTHEGISRKREKVFSQYVGPPWYTYDYCSIDIAIDGRNNMFIYRYWTLGRWHFGRSFRIGDLSDRKSVFSIDSEGAWPTIDYCFDDVATDLSTDRFILSFTHDHKHLWGWNKPSSNNSFFSANANSREFQHTPMYRRREELEIFCFDSDGNYYAIYIPNTMNKDSLYFAKVSPDGEEKRWSWNRLIPGRITPRIMRHDRKHNLLVMCGKYWSESARLVGEVILGLDLKTMQTYLIRELGRGAFGLDVDSQGTIYLTGWKGINKYQKDPYSKSLELEGRIARLNRIAE